MKMLPCPVLLLSFIAAPAFANVTVSSPANNTEVSSPFQLSAWAAPCSGQPIAAMGYSFDNSWDTTIVKSTSVQTKVVSGTGVHVLHVKSWGNQGAACVTDVSITVTPPPAGPVVPSEAISVSNIQGLNNWRAAYDTATGSAGGSMGAMELMNSPSRTGQARAFATSFSNFGGERYFVSFGDDTQATNFLYDGWVYIPGTAAQIANVEMDMNQTMPNGQTVIFGFQCDGWSRTWDYTANNGTPQRPVDTWIHSQAPCNVHTWATDTWHHVQVSYSRDDDGNVTYKSVWLDDVQQSINATVPSAFALGWGPVLLTNFQIDGATVSGSSVVYLDDLTIYRW